MANYDVCITSVAFREPYITHSKRQQGCIQALDNIPYWADRDALPTKDKIIYENIVEHFQKSLYGFKPHAIEYQRKVGYEKVIWFDPSVLPISPMKIIIDALDEYPVIVRSGEHSLAQMTNTKAKHWFDVTDDEIRDVKHIGGTIYGFNFKSQEANGVFELWKRAEENGIFGTQDEFMAGHWADESCMALALYKCGMKQFYPNQFRYLNQKEF